jgi:citrate lyase beta subunit
VRIGGNDILNILGARRSKRRTAYDGPLGPVIRDLPPPSSAGFQVSAPVFEHFSMGHMLEEEIERDLEHGIMTKTAIHPDQVRLITAAIARAWKKVIEAKAILDVDALAVFGSDGSMCEPATHRTWAAHVIARAQAFGIAEYDNVTAIRPTLPVENRS